MIDEGKLLVTFAIEAQKKNKELEKLGMTCVCGSCDLCVFRFEEIRKIIMEAAEE